MFVLDLLQSFRNLHGHLNDTIVMRRSTLMYMLIDSHK